MERVFFFSHREWGVDAVLCLVCFTAALIPTYTFYIYDIDHLALANEFGGVDEDGEE